MVVCHACPEPASKKNGFCKRHWAFLPYDLHRDIWAGENVMVEALLEISLREDPPDEC